MKTGALITRRQFLHQTAQGTLVATIFAADIPRGFPQDTQVEGPKPASPKDWLDRWEKSITSGSRSRYCDKETGEEIGWLISPFLRGFYYGYLATLDVKWADLFVDWASSWIKRGISEPDGFLGWPKGGSGGALAQDYYTDSLLGEAMGLRPVVFMADVILKTPTLKDKHGPAAESWLKLAEQVFRKWDSRDCWREVKGGGLWVVPDFGLERDAGKWTEGYARRKTTGFSHPANKQNHIAGWLIAMQDATGETIYRERAEQWWRLMKARMQKREDDKYFVWNYWDPAGPWDYKSDGAPRHWVGVHPNGGYYAIDVEGIVNAFQHDLVFAREDISRLVATNRDFMWNQQVREAKFRRIDGGQPDERWKNSPGVLWTALLPYDAKLRELFLANHDPAGWDGLSTTPWYLSRVSRPPAKK